MGQAPKDIERYKFAEFLCMNDEQRIQTYGYCKQKDFAEDHGISEKTLTLWKLKDAKFKKLKADLQMDMWDSRLSNVMDALYERAVVDKDVSAQKEYAKIVGVSRDKLEIISQNDIASILASVVEIIQEFVSDEEVLSKISEKLMDLSEEL